MQEIEVESKAALLWALKKIREAVHGEVSNNLLNRSCGICTNVFDIIREKYPPNRNRPGPLYFVDGQMESLFMTWEKFSGSVYYPVPDPDNKIHGNKAEEVLWAHNIYSRSVSGNCIWEGAYGDLRIELLVHMINKLEEKIND